MKKSSTRLMSFAMALVMCVGMVPGSVFADGEPAGGGGTSQVVPQILPTLAINDETGFVEPDIEEGEIAKFHISDTAEDETLHDDASVQEIAEFADVTVTAAQYITFYAEDGTKLGTVQYQEGVTVLPVNNALVKAVSEQAYLSDTAYDSTDVAAYKTAIAADKTNIAALPAGAQKTFLETLVAPYVTASSLSDTIEADITAATNGTNLGVVFANYETRVAAVEALTGADAFKAYLETRLSDLNSALINNTNATGDASLLQAYPAMYANKATFNVSKYVMNGTNLVVYFNQSSSWGQLMEGELEYWLHSTLLPYVSSYYPTFNQTASSVTCIMPDSNETTTQTFFYGAHKIAEYDDDYMDELLEPISMNFDEFVFDWVPYYVQYDASGHGTIGLIGYGDFGYNESYWTRRDQAEFRDWYTFDVAESIYLSTGCDVKIHFVDWNNVVAAPTVTLNASSFGASNNKFTQIASMLNTDFEEYDDLEFAYSVNGTSKTVNVTMRGTNFRDNYDIWNAVDRTDFDNWVESIMALSIMSYQDSDIRIKLYDKRGDLIDTYEITYDDVAVDLEDVEDYLNNSYYSWGGIYWDFDVRSGTEGTVVNVEGDFRTSDSEWKDLTSAELASWTQELALYIIESVPRNLTINLQNENGSTVKTYNFKRAGFVESYNFAQALNGTELEYEGLDFEATVDYDSSYVTVDLNGVNWSYSDRAWKDVKNTSAFKEWVEEAIGVPTASEFGKDVRVYVYDEDNRQCASYSFSKKIGNGNGITTSIKSLQDALNKYAYNLETDKGDIKVTYTASYTTPGNTDNITVKAKLNVASNNSKWTAKDSFEYNRLISIIKARAAWVGKNVTINVLDSSNKILDTFTSGATSDILTKDISGEYDLSGAYYDLATSVYVKNGKVDINAALAGYLADKADSTGRLRVLIDAKTQSSVSAEIPKAAVSAMKAENVYLVFQMKGMDISVDCSSFVANTDYTITITPKTVSAATGTAYIPVQYAVEATKDISVGLRATGNLNGGTFKLNGTTWSITSTVKDDSMVVAAGGVAANFVDITNSPYAEDIRKLSAYGIMNGVGNNMFSPATILTRAEACQIVVNGVAPNATPSGYFVDVSANSWYYDAVMKAHSLGIVNGFGNGYFGPTQTLTYDQFITILVRLGESLKISQPSSGYASGFNCGEWARNNVGIMSSLGVIDASTYNGSKTVSREAAAHLLCSYLEAVGYIA